MNDLLTTWTLNTIKSNPELFGGDYGNSLIMLQYFIEVLPDDKITSLTKETVSNAVTVSRIKNELLLKYSYLDYRKINKPKQKRQPNSNQGQLFNIRELLSNNELKILDYLDSDPEHWYLTAERIKHEVSDVDIMEIKCVLRHEKLYKNVIR